MFGNGTKVGFKMAASAVAAIGFILMSSVAFAESAPKIAGTCREDLASRQSINPSEVKVVTCESVNWPDASLGLPEPGKMYAQVVTPGWRIVLEAHSIQYLYDASKRNFKYGGPICLSNWSVLYLVPVENEPNLNGDLYQTPIVGGKPKLIQKGVSDFYPQADGTILASRRTSRSGFDLLFIDPSTGRPGKVIAGAFEFGPGVVKDGKWMAFQRPMLSRYWEIAYGSLNGKSDDVKTMSVPVEKLPASLFWQEKYLMAAFHDNNSYMIYQVCGEDYKPIWKDKEIRNSLDPRAPLNKSEAVYVSNEGKDGSPFTKIARVWFNNREDLLATVNGFKYEHSLRSPGTGTMVLTGLRGEDPAVCVVNLQDGTVIWRQPAKATEVKILISPSKSNAGAHAE